ncbi:MAG: hypothetical protein COC15_02615 [Legionellales bacterium]|nr:MAG: hypothetical protein COC15_02615 [Legionellales bacterium]
MAVDDLVDAELTGIFIEEAQDLLGVLDAVLQQWGADLTDLSFLDALQRDLHTVKGGARMVQQTSIADVAHALESLYVNVKKGSVKASKDIFSLAAKTHALMALILDAILVNSVLPDNSAIISELNKYDKSIPVNVNSKPAKKTLKNNPIITEEVVRVKATLLNNLNSNLAAASMHNVHILQQINVLQRSVSESAIILQLQQLEELVTAQEIQQQTALNIMLQVQMVPFSSVVARLERIASNVSQELQKQVNFKIICDNGEIDRELLNKIIPTLEHMLRNSLDHGIEDAVVRAKNCKDPHGNITVTFKRCGNRMVIEFVDDGGGIDAQQIITKAKKLGIIATDIEITKKEAFALLFAPGFSTKETVTAISGRGVGLDVVNVAIKKLGGNIDINSTLHLGTKFTITVPFSAMLNNALIFSVADQKYGIAVVNIKYVARIAYENLADQEFTCNNNTYKLYYLGALLQLKSISDLEYKHTYPVIIAQGVDTNNDNFAIIVDVVLHSQRILMQTLGVQGATLQHYVGGSVLSDGSIAVILEPNNLVVTAANKNIAIIKQQTILVVDDSLTIRKVSENLLQRNGYKVILAADGVIALELLQSQHADLILSDIEMPNMSGFELVAELKQDLKLKNIPIIMISSRSGSKHQQHALSLGVNRFIGKPFLQAPLLETIDELLQ